MLTYEFRYGTEWNYDEKESKERLFAALQQMFPISAEETIDRVKSLTESYHKYKREYVPHLGFNPNNNNLSK